MYETLPSSTALLLLVCSSALARAPPVNSFNEMHKKASIILGSQSHTVGACEDFYDYVCQTQPTGTKDYKSRTTDDPEKKLQAEIMPLLTSKGPHPGKQTAVDKVKMAFLACLQAAGDDVWKEAAMRILRQHELENWPLIHNGAKEAHQSLEDLLMKTGLKPFFQMSVVNDDSIKEGHRLFLEQQDYVFIRLARMESSCTNVEFGRLQAYARYAMYCISKLSPRMSPIEVFDTVYEILALEVELAKISETKNGTQIKTLKALDDLENIFSGLSFSKLLRKDIPQDIWPFRTEYVIQVRDVESFFSLGKYLENTDRRVLQNLIGWILIRDLAQFTTGNVQKMFPNMHRQHDEDDEDHVRPSREELCFRCLAGDWGIMRPAVEHMFLKKYFNKEAKVEVIKITEKLHQEFEHILRSFNWMDTGTLSAATEKLRNLKYKIAFWDNIIEESYIESLYKHLPIFTASTTFLEMYYDITKNNFLTNLEKLAGSIRKDGENYINPFGDQMFYDGTQNSLVLPAAYLYRLGFQTGLPPESKFGGLGMIISTVIASSFGHEALRLPDDKDQDEEQYSAPDEKQEKDMYPSSIPKKYHGPLYEDGHLNYKYPKIKRDEYKDLGDIYNPDEYQDEYPAQDEYQDEFKNQPPKGIPLWSNYTRTQFLKHSECLQQKMPYSNDLDLSESDLMNEFIFEAWTPVHFPDYIGLRVAYKAYMSTLKTYAKKNLLGLSNFCENQLFFTAYALTFCKSMDDAVNYDKEKINENLAMFSSFAEAFRCPVKSRMNKADTCTLIGNIK